MEHMTQPLNRETASGVLMPEPFAVAVPLDCGATRRQRTPRMAVTIQTPYGARDLHVCKDGDGENDGWVHLYGCSFPGGQRQSVQQIRELMQGRRRALDPISRGRHLSDPTDSGPVS